MKKDHLSSFLAYTRRPFVIEDLMIDTGLTATAAKAEIASAIAAGRLSALPSGDSTAYLARPGFTPRTAYYYDFRPDPAKLRAILDAITKDTPYSSSDIAKLVHQPLRTTQRYIATLVYLGCLATTRVISEHSHRKYARYTKVGETFNPLHIPFFYATVRSGCPPCVGGQSASTNPSTPVEQHSDAAKPPCANTPVERNEDAAKLPPAPSGAIDHSEGASAPRIKTNKHPKPLAGDTIKQERTHETTR